MYEPLSWALIRAPLLPVDIQHMFEACESGDSLMPDDPQVRLAVSIASPALVSALDRTHPLDPAAPRLWAKLLRYLIRMSTRPTPFGVFAGVGLVRWAPATDLALAVEPPCTRTRPDMAWLLDLVAHLERDPEIRSSLRLVTSTAISFHSGRAVLADGPTTGVSVRATGAVRRVLELAQFPTSAAQLAALIAQTFGATPEKASRLVDELWVQGFLLSELRPPITGRDPTSHILASLAGIPAARTTAEGLRSLVGELARWDQLAWDARADQLPSLLKRASAVHEGSEGTNLLQTDSALSLAGTQVNLTVGTEAAYAAELLLRLSPYPEGLPEINDYRRAFEVKYGANRQVPLVEMLDPDTGLGPPASYLARNVGGQGKQRRYQLLLDLALEANRDHRLVVELSDEQIADLTTSNPSPNDCPPSLDISVFVAASSTSALDEGTFQLVVGPNLGAPAAGRHLGRFADLLGPAAQIALAEIALSEKGLAAGSLMVEVVYLPERGRSANVAIRPVIREHEVVIGTRPGVPQHCVVPLGELVVGVRSGRFVVSWPEGRVEVVGMQGHMLNSVVAPPAARFLLDAAVSGRCYFASFSWGPAEEFSFLPRVQQGRIVLSLAQWRIDPNGPLNQKCPDKFASILAAWRVEWGGQRYLYLTEGDNRLLIDLDNARHVELLQNEVRKTKNDHFVVLQEALPGPHDSWLPGAFGGRHICEIVVSMTRCREMEGITSYKPSRADPRIVEPHTRLRPPGSEWLFMKLYCSRSTQDEVIATHLRTFAEFAVGSSLADSWFFVRFADPEHHLRIRFHGQPGLLMGALMNQVCAWATNLLESGHCSRFSFETYEREIERYGGEDGIQAAEAIFTADGPFAAQMVRMNREKNLSADMLILTVMSVDHLLDCLGLNLEKRTDFYREVVSLSRDGGKEYRRRQRDLRQALGRPMFFDSTTVRLMSSRRAALAHVGGQLDSLRRDGRLHRSVPELCRDYVHMHINCLVGLERAQEQLILEMLRRTRESLSRAPFD
jgi:thiopeptide-type bacteriocin biosynthesis protein